MSGLYTRPHALLAYCYRVTANNTAPIVIIIAITTFFGYSLESLFTIREKYTPTITAVKYPHLSETTRIG